MFSGCRAVSGVSRHQRGESRSQPASLQSAAPGPENGPIPPCPPPFQGSPAAPWGGPAQSARVPFGMWIPWLMNEGNSSGLSEFFADCRLSPQRVKPLAIEATYPHSGFAVGSNRCGRRYIDASTCGRAPGRRPDPKPLYGLWSALRVRSPHGRSRRLPAHGPRRRPAHGAPQHAGRRLGRVAGRARGAALPADLSHVHLQAHPPGRDAGGEARHQDEAPRRSA